MLGFRSNFDDIILDIMNTMQMQLEAWSLAPILLISSFIETTIAWHMSIVKMSPFAMLNRTKDSKMFF